MAYALVINSTVEAVQGRLPRGADADGQWIQPVTEANAASCGWFPVVDVPRPANTATDTHDRTIELVAGTPTVVWTQRAKTQAELDADAYSAHDTTIRDQATGALTTNRDYLAVPAPTNTQVVAQVRSLTQQNVKLIRLALGLLEGTD